MSENNNDLLTSVDGPVARITFNRPQARNSITSAMVLELGEFLAQVAQDRRVRCVVLSGAGDHFMAGGDVAGFDSVLSLSPEERRSEFTRQAEASIPIFQHLLTMPQATVVQIRGACAGSAVGFAACCDFVIADDTSMFLVAHVNIGTSPDGGTSYGLPRKVGPAKALEMALLGGRVSAEEALAAGLLNKLTSADELEQEVEALVKRIVGLPASSVRNIKELFRQSMDNSVDAQLKLEAVQFGNCTEDPNFVEGVSSFLEKRRPVFNQG